jgi:Ca-activated chloride channel family protein
MKFVNTQYLTYAFVAIIVFGIVLNRLNSQFFKWVKSYWFFDRTIASRISTVLYTLSLFLMMAALLDLRGPEKKIKASIPDQRTIILIDSSTSMLAEDVRPNRFVKSLQLARHFVKNAAGHQISIVLFSDVQKRLIPFTDDIDLIDSRLAALEKTNSVAGGSNISQAIEEAIQYFEFDSSDDDKSKSGNMLVFTDAEESEGAFKVNIPPNVNLAIVGTGTLKGANIPLRWEDGSFRGYKIFKGEPVITKLDEDYIRKMGKNVKNFKYWIANSYSLPTDEIINFFRAAFSNKQSTGDLRIRPVFSHYILIPAILLYCLSVLIGRFPLFKVSKNLVLVFLILGMGTWATRSEAQDQLPKAQVLTTPEIKKDLELIQEGNADREYVLKTAEKMLRAKDAKRATELYSEYAKKSDSEEVRFNYATSLLKSNKLKEALPIIQDLMKNSKNEDLKDKMRKNLRTHVEQKKKQEKQNKEEEKDNKDNKDKKDNQDKKDDKQNPGQGKQPKEGDKKNKDGKDQKQDEKQQGQQNKQQDKQQGKQDGKQDSQQNQKPGQGKPQNGEDKKDNKSDSKDKDKKEGKGKEGKDKDKDKEGEGKEEDNQASGPSTLEEKEKDIEQKRRMTKTPAMIKQIMNDDRDLQKKMMDTSTNERGEQKPKRDW